MIKSLTIKLVLIIAVFADAGFGCEEPADSNQINSIITQMRLSQQKLNSLEAKIEYRFAQPILDSETIRTGVLYYQKNPQEPNRSKLRINFLTLKQDDSEPQIYKEDYVFDGVWLVRIDYQLKNVEYRQLADSAKPMNAFELAGSNFGPLSFWNFGELDKNFEISLAEPNSDKSINFNELSLKIRQESSLKSEYEHINIWVEKSRHLPCRITALAEEGDIYDIKFLDVIIDEKLKNSVFEVETPKDFSKNTIPMQK